MATDHSLAVMTPVKAGTNKECKFDWQNACAVEPSRKTQRSQSAAVSILTQCIGLLVSNGQFLMYI